MRRLTPVLVAVVVALAVAARVDAQTTSPGLTKLAPPVACTSANRMDIFVDEDDILWECVCEWLRTGNICRWQVIGGVDSTRIRRKIALHLLPRRFYFHAATHRLWVLA